MAIEAATRLKTKNVHAEVTVRDIETGKTISVKHPLEKVSRREFSGTCCPDSPQDRARRRTCAAARR
jgi:hypothetical protein